MLVDYTTVLDGQGVSVEGLTQQGVESIVEVTPMSDVTSDGSSDPSLRLRLLRELRVVAQTTTGVVIVCLRLRQGLLQQPGCPVVVQGASLAEVQGKVASQTPPPAEARGKSHAAPAPAPAPDVGAPAPCAGDDAVYPGDWTDLAPYDAVDAPPGEKAKRGSQTYVQCT
jgi:hypothetical protein